MKVQCCECKRVQAGDGWISMDETLSAPVSHTYCPHCLTRTRVGIFSSHASENGVGADNLVHAMLVETFSA
jgi:hypothetical protein